MDWSVLLGLVATGAGLFVGTPRKADSRDAWQSVAETYGLEYKPARFWSGPKLAGPVGGNNLQVDVTNWRSASAATRFRLDIPSLGLGLKLRKKGFWNSLGPRVMTGDTAFDSQVVTEGLHSPAVREFLTAERRKALMSFINSFKHAVVTDKEISLKARGCVKKPVELMGAIDALQSVAAVVADEEPPTPAGRSDVDAVRETPEAEATAVPVSEDHGEPDPEAPPDSLTSTGTGPGVEEFCATVFAPGALSFSANEKFKQTYEGQQITWAGTLQSVSPVTFDFDFGAGRGLKGVLTILEGQGSGSRNVEAVVRLPPDMEGLGDKIGQRLAFTGKLLKVDGFSKRVVVADAELGDGTPG